VNDVLIIDAWTSAATGKTHVGKINLAAGQKVNIRVDFAEKSGDAKVKLEWESKSNSREVVPQNQLYTHKLNTSVQTAATTDIVVYPNPASGKVTIESYNRDIQGLTITDILGRTILIDNEPFAGSKILNISKFKSGVYFIRISSDNQVTTRKLIKN
jgi:hypothetical protein